MKANKAKGGLTAMILKRPEELRRSPVIVGIVLSIAIVVTFTGAWALFAQVAKNNPSQHQSLVEEWGAITAPVFNRLEMSPGYKDEHADMFAGPDKFAADKDDRYCYQNYFCGVLPNGRMVKPAGKSAQIGMNPLGAVLTPDGKYLITSNDDEREEGFSSYHDRKNFGGYSLSVINTDTLKVVSHLRVGKLFIGLQATGSGPDRASPPYTVWASGGGDNDIKMVTISAMGEVQGWRRIRVSPISWKKREKGIVSNYTPTEAFDKKDDSGNKLSAPSQFDRINGAQISFPAGSALSSDGKRLYVACNGDNSLAVINTEKAGADPRNAVSRHIPVGHFPYGVSIIQETENEAQIAVSNWGIMEYQFADPQYDDKEDDNDKELNTHGPPRILKKLGPIPGNGVDGFYTPRADSNKTSSVAITIVAKDASQTKEPQAHFVPLGNPLDEKQIVGDTHPSAMAVLHPSQGPPVLYVTKTNNDSLAVIDLSKTNEPSEVELPFFHGGSADNPLKLRGTYPNAIAISKDPKRGTWIFVAEAGINAVAVLNAANPLKPELVGRIPAGWYPTSVTVSPDGKFLYVTNAKGIGEDINRKTDTNIKEPSGATPTGLASDERVDSNYVFGTVQKIPMDIIDRVKGEKEVESYNFTTQSGRQDARVVPMGSQRSQKITHVFFILHENKTFDSMLGNNRSGHFEKFASMFFNDQDGHPFKRTQFTGVSSNTQLLATTFATAVNYYSDSEESDAGHQFAASGTASDYTEKTLLVKNGRGLLVNKNFEPEDYPEHGYIFNNAARNGVSFKDYGAMVRIAGTDTGENAPTGINDPGEARGKLGYPLVLCYTAKDGSDKPCNIAQPLRNMGDVTSEVAGLGQSYFMRMPVLAILGTKNSNGEDRLDHNYPGYNFNISDQRRALEFMRDFDRMEKEGTLPQFLYIYQPNDHTGSVRAPNAKDDAPDESRPSQQVADGDVALGMVVDHIMRSSVYYDKEKDTGSAIFITWDDAQSSLDHIHPHRTPLIVVSPYAKPGYIAKHHYSTASIVKTEELLLGLPPNNLGDLLATDLRDMFTDQYNGITVDKLSFTRTVAAKGSPEGKRIWALVSRLDTSAPDRDSFRLGALARLSMEADDLRRFGQSQHRLGSTAYHAEQGRLYQKALRLVSGPARHDAD